MNASILQHRIDELHVGLQAAKDHFSDAARHGKKFYELKEIRNKIKLLEKELEQLVYSSGKSTIN
jgi:hypothetical protein